MVKKKEQIKKEEEGKAQKRLDQWKASTGEFEKRLEDLTGKAKEGYKKALEELKSQTEKAQESLGLLKSKSGEKWQESIKSLNKLFDRIEKQFDTLKLQTNKGVKTTKKSVSKLQDRVKDSYLWESLESGFDDVWEFSKKTVQSFSKEIEKATKKAKFSMENHRIQGQITKMLAKLGDEVYRKLIKEGKKSFVPNTSVKELLLKIKTLEEELESIKETLKEEEKK